MSNSNTINLSDEWDLPPPTDGPNTRARRAKGLTPYSGSIKSNSNSNAISNSKIDERYGVESGGVSRKWVYPSPEVSPELERRGGNRRREESEDSSKPSQWNSGMIKNDYDWHQEISNIPSTTQEELFQILDPALYSQVDNSLNRSSNQNRTVSTTSMIDYGSPPASPGFSINESFDSSSIDPSSSSSPHKLMSKEEWLKLGGYGNEVVEVARPSTSHSNPRTSFDTLIRPQSPSPSISSMSAATSKSNTRASRDNRYRDDDHTSSTRRTRNAPASTPAYFPSRRSPYKLPSIDAAPHDFLQSAESSNTSTFSSKPLISIPAGIKRPHVRKRSENHIPRPRNAFILFRSHAVSSGLIPKELGVIDHKNVSKVIGEIWRNLEEEEKKVWDRMAEEEKRLHGVKYPGYKYSPKKPANSSKGQPIRKDKIVAVSQKSSSKRTRGGKSLFSPRTILDADSDDEYDIIVSEGEEDLSEIEEEETAPSPRKKPRARPDISQRRVEAIAEALLQGESKGISAIVDRKLGIVKPQLNKVQQHSNQSNDKYHFAAPTIHPGSTSTSTFALPWTPTKRSSAGNDQTNGQNLFGSPSPSTNSPFRNQPSSDNTSSSNSTISPDRKHSRFARRSNGSPNSTNFQSPYNTPTKIRPTLSSSTSGSNPFEINRLPVMAKNDSGDGNSTMQRDQSYAMAQLGVKSTPSDTISPYTLPPPRLPSYSTNATTLPPHFTYDTLPTPQFDNSPLLLNSPSSMNPTGRIFSLGRWERKASTSISQRELLAQAQEEEEREVENEVGGGQEYFDFSGASDTTGLENRRRTSIFSTLDSRSFLGGIGLGEEDEENGSTTSSFWTGDNNSLLSIGGSLLDLQSPTTSHSTSKNLGSEIVGQEIFSSAPTTTQIPLDLFQQFSGSTSSSDLFSRPLPALFKRTSSVSNTFEDDDSSSSMSWMRGNQNGRGEGEEDSTSGMGSNWDDTRSELEHYFGLLDESDRLS